jgi:murein DD-endopeptidase MepM/ murein hydrolase activator NlpD
LIENSEGEALGNPESTPIDPLAYFAGSGAGPALPAGHVTSPFGLRHDPITGKLKGHFGVDLRAAPRTPVYATEGGVVVLSRQLRGYGLVIYINHTLAK